MSNSTDFQQEFDKAVRQYLRQLGATVNISFKDANGEPLLDQVEDSRAFAKLLALNHTAWIEQLPTHR